MTDLRSLLGIIVVSAFLIAAHSSPAQERDYLDAGEIAGIAGGTVALFGISQWVHVATEDRGPNWRQPLGFEQSLTDWLGADPKPGYRNFMDPSSAAFINIIAHAAALASLDAMEPRGERGRDIGQTQFLYWTGALAQKGATDLAKKLIRRQRPLAYLYPDSARVTGDPERGDWRESFYSGHTSSAFYAATWVNIRTRAVMRTRLSGSEFDTWGWVAPVVLYGWAGYVGLSRIHANKHWFLDVAVGAVAGWGVGELFATFDDSNAIVRESEITAPIIQLSFPL